MPDEKAPHPGPEGGAPESPILDNVVPAGEADDPAAEIKNPVTDTGLPVEGQIRKEWDANQNGGLPTPLRGKAE